MLKLKPVGVPDCLFRCHPCSYCLGVENLCSFYRAMLVVYRRTIQVRNEAPPRLSVLESVGVEDELIFRQAGVPVVVDFFPLLLS